MLQKASAAWHAATAHLLALEAHGSRTLFLRSVAVHIRTVHNALCRGKDMSGSAWLPSLRVLVGAPAPQLVHNKLPSASVFSWR